MKEKKECEKVGKSGESDLVITLTHFERIVIEHYVVLLQCLDKRIKNNEVLLTQAIVLVGHLMKFITVENSIFVSHNDRV